MRGFGTFAAAVGVAIVLASMLYALGSATAPGTVLHAIGTIGFHGTVAAALGLIVTPPVGSLSTLALAEGFRRVTRPRTLLTVFINLRRLYWLLLLASVWFPIHAQRGLQWPAWRTGYVYAAIVGVVFGGLTMLSTITTELRKQLAEYEPWRTA